MESNKRLQDKCQTHVHYVSLWATSLYDARLYVAYLKVLKALIENLQLNQFTSKRDIYYKDVSLYRKSQRYCDNIMCSWSDSLQLKLDSDLRVFPSRKGLVYGVIKLSTGYGDYERDDCQSPELIPNFNIKLTKVLCDPPAVILVIEKDAVFAALCNHLRAIRNPDHCLVITGKGNPDSLTKRFVALLSTTWPTVRILGFVDSDVYGHTICRAYKFGSQHHVTHLKNLTLAGVYLHEYKYGYLDITQHEVHLLQNFLRYIQLQTSTKLIPEMCSWLREICRSIMLYKKAEMNCVNSGNSDTSTAYILSKMRSSLGTGV